MAKRKPLVFIAGEIVESKISDTIDGNNIVVTAAGTPTERLLKDRFNDILNVKDYGAKGNGIADDTAAFQAAAIAAEDKNAVVYVPYGVYKVSEPVEGEFISFGHPTITGEGSVTFLLDLYNDLVHKTQDVDETITGDKTFADKVTFDGPVDFKDPLNLNEEALSSLAEALLAPEDNGFAALNTTNNKFRINPDEFIKANSGLATETQNNINKLKIDLSNADRATLDKITQFIIKNNGGLSIDPDTGKLQVDFQDLTVEQLLDLCDPEGGIAVNTDDQSEGYGKLKIDPSQLNLPTLVTDNETIVLGDNGLSAVNVLVDNWGGRENFSLLDYIVFNFGNQNVAGRKNFTTEVHTKALTGTTVAANNGTINPKAGSMFTMDVTQNRTITLKAAPSGCENISILMTNGGDHVITWPTNIHWVGNTPPVLTSAGKDLIHLSTPDGGTTWYGYAVTGFDRIEELTNASPTIKSFTYNIVVGSDATTINANALSGATLGDGTAAQHIFTWGNEVAQYGTVTKNANGTLTYVLDETDANVLALTGTDTLTETFTYTYADVDEDTASARIKVVIKASGATADDPVENQIPTVKSFTHTITEDSATTTVSGNALSGSTLGDGTAGEHTFTWGSQVAQYGTMTKNANGTYTYALDNDNATVQALTSTQKLTETFKYTYKDQDNDTASGKIVITIKGADELLNYDEFGREIPDDLPEFNYSDNDGTNYTWRFDLEFRDVDSSSGHNTIGTTLQRKVDLPLQSVPTLYSSTTDAASYADSALFGKTVQINWGDGTTETYTTKKIGGSGTDESLRFLLNGTTGNGSSHIRHTYDIPISGEDPIIYHVSIKATTALWNLLEFTWVASHNDFQNYIRSLTKPLPPIQRFRPDFTFHNCARLKYVCPKLFTYFGPISFEDSEELTYLPKQLYYNCSDAERAPSQAFSGCRKLGVLPGDMFEGGTNIWDFTSVFRNCGLTKLPRDLFWHTISTNGNTGNAFSGSAQETYNHSNPWTSGYSTRTSLPSVLQEDTVLWIQSSGFDLRSCGLTRSGEATLTIHVPANTNTNTWALAFASGKSWVTVVPHQNITGDHAAL